MKKYMLDSNTIDRLLELDFATLSTTDVKVVLTTNQIDEIAQMPDLKIEKRKLLFICCMALKPELVSASIAVFGGDTPTRQASPRFNMCCFGEGEVYSKIINKNRSNSSDAIIADTAVSNGCVLVTDDIRFIAKMKRHGYSAISFDEFKMKFSEPS